MGKVIKYEDFEVWNKGHLLALSVYSISNENENLHRDLDLKNEMRVSTLSIITDLAECFKRDSNNQFNHFLSCTKGSLARLESQTMLAKKLDYLTHFEYDILNRQILEVRVLLENLKKHNQKSTLSNQSGK